MADSALCTGPNLAGLHFVTRLPATFAAETQVKTQAWAAEQWVDLGRFSTERDAASYRACKQSVEIDGHRYRAVVIQSDHLDQRKEKTLQRLLASEQKRVTDAAAALQAKTFACQADAETEAGAWLTAEGGALLPVHAEVIRDKQTLRQPGPGRPRAGSKVPSRVVYRVHCVVGEPPP